MITELEEIKLHLKDQRWRLNNLYKIVNKDGEVVQFKMNWAQEYLYDNKHNLNVILKARQLGISTFIKIYELDCSLFEKSNISCGTTADTLDNAKSLLEKVSFAYENLHPFIKNMVGGLLTDSKTSIAFANGSKIDVGTSMRGGTKQKVHISELGKIAIRMPDKAKEIKSGTLNAIPPDGEVFIESTAEGIGGLFYEIVKEAFDREKSNIKPNKMEYKPFFFPWYLEPAYKLNGEINIPSRLEDYFKKLEIEKNIMLSDEQKNWYVLKEKEQGEDMKKEFPSYPEEAFEQSTEGVIYARQLAQSREMGRIGEFMLSIRHPVHAVFDLGYNDNTSIILFQVINNCVYCLWHMEANGEHLPHYVNWINDKKNKFCFVMGNIYLPHDGKYNNLLGNVSDKLQEYGFNVMHLKKDNDIWEAISNCKDLFHYVYINQATCEELIKHLGNYRKEWNDKMGIWKDSPRHDEHSHAADNFRYLTLAFDTYFLSESMEEEYEKQTNYRNRDSLTGY